jgi:hypothetical protein
MKKEVLKYNNTTGKFQKGDTSGSLTKFKNDEVLVGPVNDKIKVRQSNTKNLRVREILRSIKPSPIDEYIKVKTATPTPTRPIEIAKREDPDLLKGIGSIYKPI